MKPVSDRVHVVHEGRPLMSRTRPNSAGFATPLAASWPVTVSPPRPRLHPVSSATSATSRPKPACDMDRPAPMRPQASSPRATCAAARARLGVPLRDRRSSASSRASLSASCDSPGRTSAGGPSPSPMARTSLDTPCTSSSPSVTAWARRRRLLGPPWWITIPPAGGLDQAATWTIIPPPGGSPEGCR